MLAAVGAGLLGIAMMWSPWSHVSLEKATVVLPVSATSVTPPAGEGDVMAIIYSGDGGWADLDRQLGNAFFHRGIPVLGVNTFKYYWRERSARQSAQELDALMTKYAAQWNKRRIWLIGFSFGADVLPTIIDQLSPANRERIAQLVLLSPSRDVTFEIELEGYMVKQGWFKQHLKSVLEHVNPIRHYDALPPLQALHGQPPTVCYYGLSDGDDSVCTEAGLPAWVQVHPNAGGHHFDGGYQPLARQMLDELPTSVH